LITTKTSNSHSKPNFEAIIFPNRFFILPL
jgi:hypothetical protein